VTCRGAAARVLVALGLAGCGIVAGRNARFEAVWTGSDRGRLVASATATWCRDAKIAQITAMRGDSGISVLIHPAESLVVGRYPIVEPGSARASTPTAALALRLLGSTSVVGYRSDSGTLTLEKVERGRVWGRFESQAKVATALAGKIIQLNGRFAGVPVTAGGASCPP
jgi:hypothetical protein